MALQELSPSACIMWELHHRLGEEISLETCGQLIESIRANGQRLSVLGRPSSRKDGPAIELIYGARRLFAAKTLGISILVDVRPVDDRTALIEMDVENRLRTDITPYERGLSYRRWLANGIFKTQAELSKALAISEAQVSRLLCFAELPAVVVGAFQSPSAIREEWAVVLAKQCRDAERRSVILRRAREHARAPQPRPAPHVFASLTEDGGLSRKPGDRDKVVKDATGAPLMRVAFRTDAVHFIIPRGRLSDDVVDMITERLRGELEATAMTDLDEAEEGCRTPTLVRRAMRNGAGQEQAPREP